MVFKILVYYLILVNLVAICMCYIDKKRAIKHKNRIAEKTLFILNFMGGCYLFLLGMYLFNHKTKKRKFTIIVPLFVIIWTCLIYYVLVK